MWYNLDFQRLGHPISIRQHFANNLNTEDELALNSLDYEYRRIGNRLTSQTFPLKLA